MKTTLTAATLMLLATAAVAAPVRAALEARPRPAAGVPAGSPAAPLGTRIAALETVRIIEMPVTWLSPVESRIGAAVEIPRWAKDAHRVQLFVDGELAASGYVVPGAARMFRTDIKSDGEQHQMAVLVYRRLLDGPEVLVRSAAFTPWLPAQ